MKIFSIVGARPQFIKAAAVSRLLRPRHQEILVHTGQHYDSNMSAVFFEELDIPRPDHNLKVEAGTHGAQTGEMLIRLEPVMLTQCPDWVLVYGDTNSTLAGALAAAKLHIPLAHVEAGLRSYNRAMPEEVNRVLTDHVSDLLFCPSQNAVDNLAAEGIHQGVHVVGDVMADALADAVQKAAKHSPVLERLSLQPQAYLLATVHRAENTDNPARLASILEAFWALDERVLFPLHPRTRKALISHGLLSKAALASSGNLSQVKNILFVEPLGYLDMVRVEQSARMILTDSGGIQKEAYWLGVPCITLRQETEWVETVQKGWNVLAGADTPGIVEAVRRFAKPPSRPPLYGEGQAAAKIVDILSAVTA